MHSLLLALPLVLPLLQDPTPAVDPERVAATVARIEEALDGGVEAAQERQAALRAATEVPAPEVVDALERAFRYKGDDADEVKQAAIQALRFLQHPDARVALEKTFRKNRAIRKHETLSGAILKAIAQHRSPESVDLLADDPFETRSYPATQARIRGLGMIRSRASLEALLRLMRSTDQRSVDRHMGDFRLALMVLTGTDQGPSSAAWLRWWSDHDDDFEVAPTRPPLPRAETRRWVEYWGLEADYGRTKRREDRGDDPERRGR